MNFIPLIQGMQKAVCFLNFNHGLSHVSTEDGKGREFRYVNSCMCGKRVEKGEWTDDNHLMGYGSSSSAR